MMDITKLRMRDLMDMKKHFGKTTVQEVFQMVSNLDEDELTDEALEVVAYLVFLTKRQENPDFTLEDAYDLSFDELNEALTSAGGDDAPLDETREVSSNTD